jgi:hypothetical protein
MPYLPSVGRCIYCLSTEGLTDEHIVPQSLGGKLVLQDASCEACRRIKSDFERVVTRQMYWPLRLRLGWLESRKHKKDRPTHWPGLIIDGEKEENHLIEIGKLPRTYVAVEMPPPGIITGEPLTDKNPELKLHLKGDKEELAKFCEEQEAGKFDFQYDWHWGSFNRMLAKIAHARLVSICGLEDVEHFLPALIKGESPFFSQFIGGVEHERCALLPPDDLALGIRYIRAQRYIFVRTTFFGQGRFPSHEIISGRIIDFDLIRTKIACAQQA